ncbi:hypothetical protein C1645_787060 [Glomus cerebriforme]|uniref:F-box domain-containing protein n=1 Tax=Glomus cerebriforme TaxID=658196 RepID=A0A397SAU6_9GLOM|nr:hypothetical protein C1645_787060 [Glomus cerebriforme]
MQNQSEEQEIANSTEEISLNKIKQPASSYLLSSKSKLLNLPQEVFIEICENVHPKDLYSLALVCKQFRTILWSNSITTQQLWNKSRLKFIPQCTYLKPPGDLSEQKFVWLLSSEISKTCQCCGKKVEGSDRKLFWEFKVLICSKCAQERTISLEKLKELYDPDLFPENVLSCLPCISETIFRNSFDYLVNATSPGYYGSNPYYWRADVLHAENEYNSLRKDERENWVNKKQTEMRNYMEVIEAMRAKENNLLLENLLIRYIFPV